MSKLIAAAAIRGAHKIVQNAEKKLAETVAQKGRDCTVEFPNTGYYLPIIYSMTGIPVKTLEYCFKIMEIARGMLPPIPEERHWLPYLGHALDAGMATLFAEEIIEACKYLIGPHPVEGIWLGAADDVIM
ncbi:MAG: CO dehydrogenase/CO-methylating acetyl-CoA synthase complex subunit beta, partial [Candidatus Brocadiales bacterium]